MATRLPRWSSLPLSIPLTAAVVAVGLASAWSRSRLGVDIWLPDLAAGLTLAIAGAVITSVDRGSRLGIIVEVAALAWFLPDLLTAAFGPMALIAPGAIVLHRAVLFHAIVAFPHGRIARSGERVIVVLAYVSILGGLGTPAIAWSVAALMAFVAIVISRAGSARDAGVRALPTMVLLAVVIGGTNLLRLLVGDSLSPLAAVRAYEGGLAAVGVVLTVSVIRYRSRLAGLTAAAVELTQGRAGYVRDLLATALRDPTVEVAFAADGAEPTTWVDELGRPIDALQAYGTRTVIPIRVDGRPVAELACESVVAGEPALRQSIETAARLAASNARLRAGLRSEAVELEASQLRLVSAADDQRIALAHQLAGGAEASLIELGSLLAAIPADAHPMVRAAVDRTRTRSDGLMADLRSLSAGLGPADLRTTGLEVALARLGAGFEGQLDVDVDASNLSDSLATATYFICAEGIANAMKHSAATEVHVKVQRRPGRVLISIVDDGIGGASIETGSGLRGLADRASVLGGSASLDSPPGAGTRISVDLPLR